MEQEIDWEKEIYGRGYQKLDLEREKRKKRDFWSALDGMSSGVALMIDWFWIFGSSVDAIQPFLKLTGEKTKSFPCPAETPCGCRHMIGETRGGELIAMCGCERGCEKYELEPPDILFHGIDFERFGDAIRQALGFAKPSSAAYVSAGLCEIATYAEAAIPVYLCLEDSNGLLRELTKLLGLRNGPFLALTPTGSGWGAEVEAMARVHGGGHIALSSVLRVDGGLKATGASEPMLGEFAGRLASLRGGGNVLQNIHQEIAALKGEFVDVCSAKQRLEKMLADGMFAFTQKVDAKSFKIFCTILADGNVSKASRTLEMADSTLRDVLASWRGKGDAYKSMLDVVRWRKKVGRTDTVALNENILLERADTSDYPGLLGDVLDGLLSMTDSNWSELAQQLVGLLRTTTM